MAWAVVYLATSAVATGDCSALAGSWRLVVLLDVLRRWRRALVLLAVWIGGRRSARPLIGAWQAVGLLVLVLRMLSHVGTGLLGRRRRERGAHLVDVKCQRAVTQLTRETTRGRQTDDVQARVTAIQTLTCGGWA